MSEKRYDTPPNSVRTLEARLRNIVDARDDTASVGTFSRLRQEIANVIVGQLIAGVTDEKGEPIFLIKGGVAMSFRLGLRARPTRDFDVACRIDRQEAIGLLRDALANGWSGFSFVLKSDPEEIRDTGAVRIDIQEQYRRQIFARVQFEMAQSEGSVGQEFDLVQHKLIALERLGLEKPHALPMVTTAYLIAQKLHACTDHSDPTRPNDRYRDLVDVLLIEATLDPSELPRVRDACVEIFGLRGKHGWPPQVVILSDWSAGYETLARSVGSDVTDIYDAQERVSKLVARIDAAG